MLLCAAKGPKVAPPLFVFSYTGLILYSLLSPHLFSHNFIQSHMISNLLIVFILFRTFFAISHDFTCFHITSHVFYVVEVISRISLFSHIREESATHTGLNKVMKEIIVCQLNLSAIKCHMKTIPLFQTISLC